MTDAQIRAIEQTFKLTRDRFTGILRRQRGLNLENYFYFDYDAKFPIKRYDFNAIYKLDYIEICTLKGSETIQFKFHNITNKERIAKMKQLIKILESE